MRRQEEILVLARVVLDGTEMARFGDCFDLQYFSDREKAIRAAKREEIAKAVETATNLEWDSFLPDRTVDREQ